jgi:hypothetical protein
MALASILLLLLLFAVLSIATLESNILEFKSANADQRKYRLINAGKQQLQLVSQRLPAGCLIQPVTTLHLINQSLKSWRQASCAGNFQTFLYYYVIEQLGNDVCSRVEHSIADYYRITLLIEDNAQDGLIAILQSIDIKPVLANQRCHAKERTVVAGQQTITLLV